MTHEKIGIAPFNIMSEERQHKIQVTIANEPITLMIGESQEYALRMAAYTANDLWMRMSANQPKKSSHHVLATVAMALAERSFEKSAQLEKQAAVLNEFEKHLDEILLKMED